MRSSENKEIQQKRQAGCADQEEQTFNISIVKY